MSIVESPSRNRFGALLPSYVSGELQGADRNWVDEFVGRDPDARRELAQHVALKAALAERFESLPADAGLATLMAAVRADVRDDVRANVHTTNVRNKRAARPSLVARCYEALAWLQGNGMRAGFAFAATVMLAQAVMLGVLLQRTPDGAEDHSLGATRSTTAGGIESLGALRVSFNPDTPERELRLLLVRVGARIIDGPNQLGEYVIRIAPVHIDEARESLGQSSWVDRIEAVRRTSE